MLTTLYNKKLNKFLKVYKFFYRYRVLIIVFSVILTLSTATLLALQGMIVNDVNFTNVTYGDEYNFTVKTLYDNKASLEYKSIESNNWTKNKPVLAGNYEVRAVTKNIFGGNRYGKSHAFSIAPKQIKPSLVNSTITYGESPEIYLSGLLEGDKLAYRNCELVDITTSPMVSFTSDDFIIVNAQNENVTSCYNIDLSSIPINIAPRDIIITATSLKTYDGTPLYAEDINSISTGSLVEGDSITIVKSSSITNAGSVKPELELKVFNKQYGDVTKLYNIEVSDESYLTVNKKDLSIICPNYEKDYDGIATEIQTSQIKVDGLVSGDNIELSLNQFVYAGEYEITPYSYVIKNNNGEDVTENYNVNISKGVCKINERKLTVTTDSATFVYDGNSHSNNSYVLSEGTVANNETLIVKNEYTTDSNVGDYRNEIEFDIVDNNMNSTLDNYDLSIEYGSLSITKKEILITTKPLEFVYNGDKEPTIEDNTIEYDPSLLASTDELKIEKEPTFAGLLVGNNYKNNITVRIFDKNSGEDKTNNYEIKYDYGNVNILPRQISLTTSTSVFYYEDGEKYSYNYFDQNYELGSGDKLNGINPTIVSEKGEFDNVITPLFTNSQGNDVTSCYQITNLNYGKLLVIDDPNNGQQDIPEIIPPEKGDNNTEKGDSIVSLVTSNGSSTTLPDDGNEDTSNPDESEPNPDDTEQNPTPEYKGYFTLTANKVGDYYFRQNVYGDYEMGQLYYPSKYRLNGSDEANPNLYVSRLLKNQIASTINININKELASDVAPYYVSEMPNEQNYDTIYNYNGLNNIKFDVYSYNFLEEGIDAVNLNNLSLNKNSTNYYNYVKSNYLNVPSSLFNAIDQAIDTYNLKASNEFDTIYNIARYISNHFKISYSTNYEKNTDILKQFFEETHAGLNVHFAAATVMMLRRVGIPARLVSGYRCKVDKINCPLEIDNANVSSWTEVYSSDLKAWVMIDTFPEYAIDYEPEPTIDSDEPDGSEPENPDGSEEPETPVNPSEPDNPTEEPEPTEKYYTVVIENTENGTVVADKTSGIVGETVNLTITPNSGYQISEIYINGVSISLSTSSFLPSEGENIVKVVFSKIIIKDTFTINVITDGNGSVDVSKTSGEVGESVNFTITPNEGYFIEELLINGVSQPLSLRSFNPIKGTNTINVSFGQEDPDLSRDPISGNMTIFTSSQTFGYDGEDHSCLEYDVDDIDSVLLPYDNLIVTVTGRIRNVGSTSNSCKYQVIDTRTNADVTDEYYGHITIEEGTLEVYASKNLECKTKDISKAYDGIPLQGSSASDFEFLNDTNLLGEDYISDFVFISFIAEKGVVPNIGYIKEISNSTTNNAINNYIKIQYIYGTLTIY